MIVGMHYFSPVHRMPLLEVVRTKASDPRAVATAVALGRRQGKTVIVVRDGPAFYTTRILVPYLNEAAHLLAEGCPIEEVDAAMVDWGFPVGPFQLMDEVGIDVGAHVGAVTEEAFGERMRWPAVFAALSEDHRKGRKNGRGFYLYGRGAPKQKTVDGTVYQVLGVAPRPRAATSDEIALRCGLAMVNEALRALGDGVVRCPRDGDIGAILGVGFPPFRGGPLRYTDVLGAVEVLRRVRSLEQRFGARFEPAPLLVEMARTGKRIYG
jgi:3-hydroxyacyl-CoA dehydrogenase/enoyl-CoA hydratase/3-hydroxybutyryl-CoA epimerase